MKEKRIIKEPTARVRSWNQIVDYYRARPGLVEWLSNRHPVMRGEVADSPVPDEVISQEDAA